MGDECGGKNMSGWDSKKIHEVVSRFQSRFNEKGVGVAYYKVRWYVSHGANGGHMEYRYWMTYSDIEPSSVAVQGTPVLEGAFDPSKDYEEMDADEGKLFNSPEGVVVLGTMVDDKFESTETSKKTADTVVWMRSK